MSYHDDFTHLTKTALNVFCDSPLEYYLQFVTQEMPRKVSTQGMSIGTVLHAMLLENKTLEELVGIYPESCLKCDGSINSKPAAQFKAENPGRIMYCKEDTAETIATVYEAVSGSIISEAIEQSEDLETQFSATVNGIACKCKPDICGDMDEYIAMYDLKFMPRINPPAFNRSARNFRYWLQDAHYSAILRELTGKPVLFRFLAVELEYPHRIQSYHYDEIKRDQSSAYHLKKLDELKRCQESGKYQDNWESNLILNPWDVEEVEEPTDWEGIDAT